MSKMENITKAKKYNRIKLWFGIGKSIVSFLLVLVFIFSGLSIKTEDFIRQFAENDYAVFLLFTVIVGAAGSILFLPVNFYIGYYLEHKFGLSNQTIFKWIWENIKGSLVGAVIGIPLLVLFFYFLRYFGEMWWFPFAVILFLFSVVLAQLGPIIILPLFYKVTPFENEDLKERIFQLSKDAGLNIENIFRFDMSKNTKKANAAFTGLGKSKRIILGDTLIENYTNDQIETVIAHELGHYSHKHIIKNMIIGTVTSFLTLFLIGYLYEISIGWFGFSHITQIAALPLLTLWSALIGLVQAPMSNKLSRKFEYEADEYAVAVTGKKEEFIETLEKMNEQNLGDNDPHPFVEWFFYSHPSTKKRVEAIKAVK